MGELAAGALSSLSRPPERVAQTPGRWPALGEPEL